MGFLSHGYHNSSGSCSNDDGFENEEPFQLVRWRKEEWELDAPEDEMRDHLLSGDPRGCWDMVRNIEV